MAIGRIDRAPSPSAHTVTAEGKDLLWVLEVRGEYGVVLGEIAIRARGDLATGRLGVETLRILE